jgi:predicted enzyme related to lactoylglutathione lyase
MPNPVVHWEFWSKDPDKLSNFYEDVFDWKISHVTEMAYHMVETGGEGGIDGGIMKPDDGPLPGNMAFYIDVDDLKGYGEKIVKAGGKVIAEEMEVPGAGKFSLFADPEGRVLGLWLQDKKENS